MTCTPGSIAKEACQEEDKMSQGCAQCPDGKPLQQQRRCREQADISAKSHTRGRSKLRRHIDLMVYGHHVCPRVT